MAEVYEVVCPKCEEEFNLELREGESLEEGVSVECPNCGSVVNFGGNNTLSEEDVEQCLKRDHFSELKPKYKTKFKGYGIVEKQLKNILNKEKMSENSFMAIIDLHSSIQVRMFLHSDEELKPQLNMVVPKGYKTNTDSVIDNHLNLTKKIEELPIRKKIIVIIKKLKPLYLKDEKEHNKFLKEYKKYGCKLICPYCEKKLIKEFGSEKSDIEDEFIEECSNCNKEFKVLTGTVTLWKGRGTGVVSYGPPEYTIRIKNQNGERVMIFNSKYNLIHIKVGDIIYFMFKKKFLSSEFSDKPSNIINETTNTYSPI